MREMLVLVDDDDRVIGTAPRSLCHGNPGFIHRAVHVLVFNEDGQLYLQKRHAGKLIQPGKWDSSVGGHIAPGESYEIAARRETGEELGFSPEKLAFLFSMKVRNQTESENIQCFTTIFPGEIHPNDEEIIDGKFWSIEEIESAVGNGGFTPVFAVEFDLLKSHLSLA